jgi:8-oxo-dGTP pyrophosphatase MutT (NUDIX family)
VAVVVDRAERLSRHEPAVLAPDDLLVVHRRADWKDVYPGFWDLAFGGVCGVGETWTVSARRELSEEAGIVVDDDALVDLGPVAWEGQDGDALVGRVFLAAWPHPPTSVDGEAVAFDRVPLAELAGWIRQRSVCPDSAALVAPLLAGLGGAVDDGARG